MPTKYRKEVLDRPENAAGLNSLRGSKGYSSKTAVGNWLDVYGGPQFYQRGFSTGRFETEAQFAQKTGLSIKDNYYGSGLVDVIPKLSETKTSNLDSESIWKSSNQLMTIHSSLQKEENIFIPTNPRLKEKIDLYRQQAIADTNISRQMRFETESRRAHNSYVADKFKVDSVRIYPGSPKSLDILRNQLFENHEMLSLSFVRYHCFEIIQSTPSKSNLINTDEFSRIISSKFKVKMNKFEIMQLVAYLSVNECIDLKALLISLAGRLDDFNSSIATKIFYKILNSDNVGSVQSLIDNINKISFPEIASGIIKYFPIYSEQQPIIHIDQFIQLNQDLFASDRGNYLQTIQEIWQV